MRLQHQARLLSFVRALNLELVSRPEDRMHVVSDKSDTNANQQCGVWTGPSGSKKRFKNRPCEQEQRRAGDLALDALDGPPRAVEGLQRLGLPEDLQGHRLAT